MKKMIELINKGEKKRKDKWKFIFSFFLFVGSLLFSSCNQVETQRLNDLQVIGSHNSYKTAIEPALWDHLFEKDAAKASSLQYDHISIEEQLDLGLRSLELDVFYDPNGGLFENPNGLDIVRELGGNALEYDKDNKLSEPGFKMFHIQDIDFRSHFLLFKDCLLAMKNWSESHPNHTPIVVLMNTKDKKIEGLTVPKEFSKEAFKDLDAEITSILDKDQLITPGKVRGSFNSLEKAVLTNGWPSIEESLGKFIFVLDEKEPKREKYLEGTSRNGILFVNANEGNSEAGFRIVNNPIRDFEYIKELVSKGYMVRTRADAGTKESRSNDYTKFEKAKASGAQVISTDYYIPTTLYPSDFKISFEGNTYERIK